MVREFETIYFKHPVAIPPLVVASSLSKTSVPGLILFQKEDWLYAVWWIDLHGNLVPRDAPCAKRGYWRTYHISNVLYAMPPEDQEQLPAFVLEAIGPEKQAGKDPAPRK